MRKLVVAIVLGGLIFGQSRPSSAVGAKPGNFEKGQKVLNAGMGFIARLVNTPHMIQMAGDFEFYLARQIAVTIPFFIGFGEASSESPTSPHNTGSQGLAAAAPSGARAPRRWV